jgi:hypothetical protein
MAVMKQGILGGLQNKIGSVVGSSWKGIAVLKSKPLSVANPKTAAQLAQRAKMTNIVAFAVIILADIIKPLWDRFASKMSGYNDFVTTNIALFAAAMPSPVASFQISKGKMAATVPSSVVCDVSNNTSVISWVDDTGEGLKLTTDQAFVVMFNATLGKVSFAAALDARGDSSTNCLNPVGTVVGNAVHCYLAFRRVDGTVVSNTGYKIATVQA